MKDQPNKGKDKSLPIIDGWEEKLEKIMSPAGPIIALKTQGNNLIISFKDKIPEDGMLSLINEKDGPITLRVGEMLQQQANKSYRQGIENAIEVVKREITDGEFERPGNAEDERIGWILSGLIEKLESLKNQSHEA